MKSVSSNRPTISNNFRGKRISSECLTSVEADTLGGSLVLRVDGIAVHGVLSKPLDFSREGGVSRGL